MNIFKKIFGYKIDNSNKKEPFTEDGFAEQGGVKSDKKGFRWRFPLSPIRTFLTILAVCLLAFSLSYYSAWFFGYQSTVYLLYFGFFFLVIMIITDIKALIDYYRFRKEEKSQKGM